MKMNLIYHSSCRGNHHSDIRFFYPKVCRHRACARECVFAQASQHQKLTRLISLIKSLFSLFSILLLLLLLFHILLAHLVGWTQTTSCDIHFGTRVFDLLLNKRAIVFFCFCFFGFRIPKMSETSSQIDMFISLVRGNYSNNDMLKWKCLLMGFFLFFGGVNGFVAVGAHPFAHGAQCDTRTIVHESIENENRRRRRRRRRHQFQRKVIYYI